MSTPDNPQQSRSTDVGSDQPATELAADLLPDEADEANPAKGAPSAGLNPPPWQRTATRTGTAAGATAARTGTAAGATAARTGTAAGATAGWTGTAAGATALIDAPTTSLTAEALGMRLQAPAGYLGDGESAADAESGHPFAASLRPRVRGRVPRRASLQIKRFDPWSVLKLALVLGVALFLVWMFAVGVLYGVLGGMGVWDKLNGTFAELTSSSNGNGQLITASGVFGVAAVVGVITTVLFTALASVSAFIYNVAADVAGGIEVTLSERD